MSTLIKILAIAIGIGIGVGFYYRLTGDITTGDKFIGVSVLVSSFVLLPLFLYHRWKGKRLKDYTLTEENLKKMKDQKREDRK